MAREFFKNLPNTTTPLTAPRLNALLDGDEAMGNIVVDSITGKNMFNKNNLSETGKYVNSNGVLISYSGLNVSDYIPVKPGEKITISGLSNPGNDPSICFYNSSKTFVSGISHYGTNPRTITVPANCYYIRESINTTDLNTAQIEKGESVTDYAEFQGVGYVSGQNSNGYYVKYDDGRLECYADKEFTGLSFTASGSLYKCDISSPFTFPIAFISAPTISIQTQSANDYSYSFVYAVRKSTTAITTLELMRVVSASNVSVPIGYIAKGRWK